MRPGVILCKLGNWYAPEVLPLRKIYDIDGMRLQVRNPSLSFLLSNSITALSCPVQLVSSLSLLPFISFSLCLYLSVCLSLSLYLSLSLCLYLSLSLSVSFLSSTQLKGLHFKHTDNFNYWLKSLRHIGLPEVSHIM